MASKYNAETGERRKPDYYVRHKGTRIGCYLNHGIKCYDVWIKPFGKFPGTDYLCSVQIHIKTEEYDVRKAVINSVRQMFADGHKLDNVPDEMFEYRHTCTIPLDSDLEEKKMLKHTKFYKNNKLKSQKQHESETSEAGSGEVPASSDSL